MKVTGKVMIDVDGKTIELTMDQAEELHTKLGDILGKKSGSIFPPPIYPQIFREPPYTGDAWTNVTYVRNSGEYHEDHNVVISSVD